VGVGLKATDTLIAFPERGSKVEYRSASILPEGQVATAMVDCVVLVATLSHAERKERICGRGGHFLAAFFAILK
jgi:hypothetical protein